jgi:predicted glycosyltransferase
MRTSIHYTGFVVPSGASAHGLRPRRDGIVVSAGGGIVGGDLLDAAVGAHRLLGPHERMRMKVIGGPFLPEDRWRSLREAARGLTGVTLRRSVPDLCAELRAAAAAVSQCGYNTALDILRSRVPALVVPFADRNEDEQTKRALRLQELGLVRVLDPRALNASTMAVELRALMRFRPQPISLDLEGGPATARILTELIGARTDDVAATGR